MHIVDRVFVGLADGRIFYEIPEIGVALRKLRADFIILGTKSISEVARRDRCTICGRFILIHAPFVHLGLIVAIWKAAVDLGVDGPGYGAGASGPRDQFLPIET
jgi:hypothetical protein